MATTIYSCVYPSGYLLSEDEVARYSTRAYTGLSAWMTARKRNLATVDQIERCEVLPGDAEHTWSVPDSQTLIDGFTTDETRYVEIVVLSGARHNGVYNPNRYRINWTASANYTQALQLWDNYIKIHGLQVVVNSSYVGVRGIHCLGLRIEIDSCIVKGNLTGGSAYGINLNTASTPASAKIYNNTIYDFTYSTNQSVGLVTTSGWTGQVYNNTLVDCRYGIYANAGGTITASNNIVQGAYDGYHNAGTWGSGSVNNISNVASDAPGTGSKQATVIFADSANDDFRLSASDTEARDSGYNLYSDPNCPVTLGIQGNERPMAGAFDIGADEYFTVSSTITGNILVGKPIHGLTQGRIIL